MTRSRALFVAGAVFAATLFAWTGAAQAHVVERVSVGAGGTQASGDSGTPSVSADGRYVAFCSFAGNLVSGDTNGVSDVFVYDRQTDTLRRISVATGGAQANAESRSPVMSADGSCVAFASFASNLVSGDTNGAWDIFIHDLATGATSRVSVGSGGTQGDGDSKRVALSANGQIVCFGSWSTNLVAGDTNATADVFVYDRQAGTTERVSVASDGAQGDDWSDFASISIPARTTWCPGMAMKDSRTFS
jgi:Tol biopolymer transport system component